MATRILHKGLQDRKESKLVHQQGVSLRGRCSEVAECVREYVLGLDLGVAEACKGDP